jgi:hypothetical protein
MVESRSFSERGVSFNSNKFDMESQVNVYSLEAKNSLSSYALRQLTCGSSSFEARLRARPLQVPVLCKLVL